MRNAKIPNQEIANETPRRYHMNALKANYLVAGEEMIQLVANNSPILAPNELPPQATTILTPPRIILIINAYFTLMHLHSVINF